MSKCQPFNIDNFSSVHNSSLFGCKVYTEYSVHNILFYAFKILVHYSLFKIYYIVLLNRR